MPGVVLRSKAREDLVEIWESHVVFHVPLQGSSDSGIELVPVIHASRDLESTWREGA